MNPESYPPEIEVTVEQKVILSATNNIATLIKRIEAATRADGNEHAVLLAWMPDSDGKSIKDIIPSHIMKGEKTRVPTDEIKTTIEDLPGPIAIVIHSHTSGGSDESKADIEWIKAFPKSTHTTTNYSLTGHLPTFMIVAPQEDAMTLQIISQMTSKKSIDTSILFDALKGDPQAKAARGIGSLRGMLNNAPAEIRASGLAVGKFILEPDNDLDEIKQYLSHALPIKYEHTKHKPPKFDFSFLKQ